MMKKATMLLLALVLLIMAQSAALAYFNDGTDLMKGIRAYEKYQAGLSLDTIEHMDYARFMGYVVGCCDALEESIDCGFTIPSNATVGQIMAVVVKYMNNNPEMWNLPASTLIHFALIEAFPEI